MKVLWRLSSWFRNLFQSDDIPLRVFLSDGRVLYDKHPLVRHGLVTSLKHDIALAYKPPTRVYQHRQSGSPPVFIGREYRYTADKELTPTAKVEAMHGFFQDGLLGVEYRALIGPAWRRHINLHTILRRSCMVGSTAFLIYALARNDFEGLRQLATLFKGWISWSQSLIAEEPHWVILVVVSALLSVLLGGLVRMAWSRLRRFGRRKPRWWELPLDK